MAAESTRIELPDPGILDAFRRMSQAERAQVVSNAHRAARTMIESQLRFQHPDWDESQIHQELLKRMIGGAA
ncbi:MAG: hypothetical protein AB7U20_00310 [Planctomycetaceae bacterium]